MDLNLKILFGSDWILILNRDPDSDLNLSFGFGRIRLITFLNPFDSKTKLKHDNLRCRIESVENKKYQI